MTVDIRIRDKNGVLAEFTSQEASIEISMGSSAPPPVPEIPFLDEYYARLIKHGTTHATNGLAGDPEKKQDHALYYQGNYDRLHVMRQAWGSTSDPTQKATIRTYINEVMDNLALAKAEAAFGGTGYRNYTHGIVERIDELELPSDKKTSYIRTALLIALRSAYAPPYNVVDVRWVPEKWGHVVRSRETALAVHSHLLTRKWISQAKDLLPQTGVWGINKYELAEYQDRYISEAIEKWMLGIHIPQWIQAANDGVAHEAKYNWAPFMMALTVRSLIRYYNDNDFSTNKDKIIPALSNLADVVYPFAYREIGDRFGLLYRPVAEGDVGPSPDLSLLVFPWFAWLWKQTGEKKYLDWSHKLFESGVRWAWMDGGKQFNQSYLWSMDGIKYLD